MSCNWFTQLTGLPDDHPTTVRDGITIDGSTLTSAANGRVMQAGTLTMPSLFELRSKTGDLMQTDQRATLREIVADAQDLHRDPSNTGAIFQVASQFNLLEMIGPSISPEDGIARYEHDRTQGPACAIACGAGTIFRNYFAPVDQQIGQTTNMQIDCLADLGVALGNQNAALWRMKNGYALPTQTGLAQLNKAIARGKFADLTGHIRIGLQTDTEVTLGPSPHLVTQAYCSALPIAYSDQSPWHLESLARLILSAAYEATFHAAVLNKSRTGNKMVFLTLLGGGAFGNDTALIVNAIRDAFDRFANAGLDIAIVSYGRSSPAISALIT